MIVYKLSCKNEHAFDGWFRDGAAADGQLAAGQVVCPSCGSTSVRKSLMTPRLAKGHEEPAPPQPPAAPAPQAPEGHMLVRGEMVRLLREMRRHVEAHCDYVGPRFAEEARKIHHGEIEKRDIYGEASPEEAAGLRDDGIEVVALPWVPPHDA